MGGDPVTPDPLLRFEAEHREALSVLDRLEEAATAFRNADVAAAHVAAARDAHAFLAGPVRAHNQNEERALFPALGPDAPTAIFIEEHQRLWALERELEGALAGADLAGAAATAFELIDLLRTHIAREDDVLFPLARERLGAEGLARVAAALAE